MGDLKPKLIPNLRSPDLRKNWYFCYLRCIVYNKLTMINVTKKRLCNQVDEFGVKYLSYGFHRDLKYTVVVKTVRLPSHFTVLNLWTLWWYTVNTKQGSHAPHGKKKTIMISRYQLNVAKTKAARQCKLIKWNCNSPDPDFFPLCGKKKEGFISSRSTFKKIP